MAVRRKAEPWGTYNRMICAANSTRQSLVESLLLRQKRFTADFLTKELRVNNGEVPQYYVENSHEAIIAPEEFEAVQEEMARRKELGRAYSDKAFHSKILSQLWKSNPLTVPEWNERLWITLLDMVIVKRDGSIVFRFKSKKEIIAWETQVLYRKKLLAPPYRPKGDHLLNTIFIRSFIA